MRVLRDNNHKCRGICYITYGYNKELNVSEINDEFNDDNYYELKNIFKKLINMKDIKYKDKILNVNKCLYNPYIDKNKLNKKKNESNNDDK